MMLLVGTFPRRSSYASVPSYLSIMRDFKRTLGYFSSLVPVGCQSSEHMSILSPTHKDSSQGVQLTVGYILKYRPGEPFGEHLGIN